MFNRKGKHIKNDLKNENKYALRKDYLGILKVF